MVVNGYVT